MEKKKEFIINVVFWAIIGLMVFAVCKFVLPVLIPFLIAFLVAALLQLPAKRLAGGREGRRKKIAVIFCVIFYVAFFLLMALIGTKIICVAVNGVASAPTFYNEKIVPFIGQVSDWLEQKLSSVDAEVSQDIEGIFTKLSENMGQYISEFSVKAAKWLSGGVTGIPGVMVKLVVTVVATFFMTADFTKIIDFFGG